MKPCFRRAVAIAFFLHFSTALSASESAATTKPSSTAPSGPSREAEGSHLDSFVMPRRALVEPPRYPNNPRKRGEEGWVEVNFMVNPEGKPYEVTILDSMGHEDFRKEALKAVERWEFQPATYQGNPIDAGMAMTLTFELEGGAAGARAPFVRRFRVVS